MTEKEIIFSAQALRETSENDMKWAGELLEMFKVDLADRIAKIKGILKNSDPNINDLRIHFHTIKSSAGSVGAVSLSEKALKLERASVAKDLEYIKEKLEEFDRIAEKSVVEFENMIVRSS